MELIIKEYTQDEIDHICGHKTTYMKWPSGGSTTINNQPERLNPEDAIKSVCDSPNSENK